MSIIKITQFTILVYFLFYCLFYIIMNYMVSQYNLQIHIRYYYVKLLLSFSPEMLVALSDKLER